MCTILPSHNVLMSHSLTPITNLCAQKNRFYYAQVNIDLMKKIPEGISYYTRLENPGKKKCCIVHFCVVCKHCFSFLAACKSAFPSLDSTAVQTEATFPFPLGATDNYWTFSIYECSWGGPRQLESSSLIWGREYLSHYMRYMLILDSLICNFVTTLCLSKTPVSMWESTGWSFISVQRSCRWQHFQVIFYESLTYTPAASSSYFKYLPFPVKSFNF